MWHCTPSSISHRVCEEMLYIGVNIITDGNRKIENMNRNRKGKNSISSMNGILWDKYIVKKTTPNLQFFLNPWLKASKGATLVN